MVDYSKWDKLVANLSDDESDGDGAIDSKRPAVTRLSDNSSIQIGPQGYMVQSAEEGLVPSTSCGTLSQECTSTSSSFPAKSGEDSRTANPVTGDVHNLGGVVSEDDLFRNGSKHIDGNSTYYWRQDRNTAVVSFVLSPSIRAKDISVSFSADKKFTVKNGSLVIFSRILRYFVEQNDTDNGHFDPFDWEIRRISCRIDPSGSSTRTSTSKHDQEASNTTGLGRYYSNDKVETSTDVSYKTFELSQKQQDVQTLTLLEVTLPKISPIPGAVLWWENVFQDHERIDVTQIADRIGGSALRGGCGGHGGGSAEDPLAQAQRIFVEKIRKQREEERKEEEEDREIEEG